MSTHVERIVLLAAAVIGTVSALSCLSCDWNAKNGTVDDNCLGAPYKADVTTCPPDTSSERFMCQTRAAFEQTSGMRNLVSLERNCAQNHASCNNECALKTTTCWLCCNDSDKCNGFPSRQNIVLVNAAKRLQYGFPQIVLCLSLMLFAL